MSETLRPASSSSIRPSAGTSADDDAAVAVDDPERAVVAAQHDVVADRERGSGDSHLLGAERAGGAHQRVRAPVEVGDVDAALGDHQRPAGVALRPPVRDQALAQLRGVVADFDPAGLVVALHRLARGAVAREPQRVALPLQLLAAVLLELDHGQAREQSAERAAGADRLQLAVVADEHQLDVESPHVVDEPGELARRHHRGLVDDQHRARRDRRGRTARRGPAAAPSRSCSGCRRSPAARARRGARARRRTRAGRSPPTPRARRPARTSCRRRPGPTTTATPSPSCVSRRTISICSPASDGRRSIARSTARDVASPTPAARRSIAYFEDPLLEREQLAASSRSARRRRPGSGVRRGGAATASRSPSASTTACGERRKPSASRSISATLTFAPAGSCSHQACSTSRRVNVERRSVSPNGPASRVVICSMSASRTGVDRAAPGELSDHLRASARARPLARATPARAARASRGSPSRDASRAPRPAPPRRSTSPRRSSSASISARRRLNARSTVGGTPAMSAIPLRTGVHSTPSSRVSSLRSRAS